MSILKELEKELTNARFGKEAFKLAVLKTFKATVENKAIEERAELSEDAVMILLKREVKMAKESLEWAEKSANEEFITEGKERVEILEKFLPEMASEQDIEQVIAGLELKDATGRNRGIIMKALKEEFGTNIDNALASKIITRMF